MCDMIKILFYARKSKTNPSGLTPIYLRVTASGQRFQTATTRFVEIKNWSQSAGRVIGNSKEAKELNEFLDVLRAKAFDIQKKLITVGSVVSIENFEKQWHGVEEKSKMLLEVFQRQKKSALSCSVSSSSSRLNSPVVDCCQQRKIAKKILNVAPAPIRGGTPIFSRGGGILTGICQKHCTDYSCCATLLNLIYKVSTQVLGKILIKVH